MKMSWLAVTLGLVLAAHAVRAEDDPRWKKKANNIAAASTQVAAPKPVTQPVQQNRWNARNAQNFRTQASTQQQLDNRNALQLRRALRNSDDSTSAKLNAGGGAHANAATASGKGHHGDGGISTGSNQNSGYNEQTRAELRAWRGKPASYEEARRAYTHEHHNRDWWRNHHRVIILIGGGYYYWNAGWWYPAWGYDSYYSSYDYDGPILGYDGLPPDQVIARVQTQLQEAGYFNEPVDGVLGPATRAALANFQRDTGLFVTATIDPPTMRRLGFII